MSMESTARFITGMKLRELRRQRDRLRAAYREVDERAREAGADVPERIVRLYHGLRDVQFAGKPLLPDLVNLEVLLEPSVMRASTPALQTLWLSRLEESLAAGRRQAEFVYLFGALLEEWTRDVARGEPRRDEARDAQAAMLARALEEVPEPPLRHREILLPLLEAMVVGAPRTRESVREALDEALGSPGEMTGAILFAAQKSPYHTPALRSEAIAFDADAKAQKELDDALHIMASEVREWDWDASGVGVYTLWTRNRWRLYLNADLPTVVLMEAIGQRWIELLSELWDPATAFFRRVRLQKLQEINAPDSIIAHQRRLLSETTPPEGLPEGAEAPYIWAPLPDGDIESGSIREQRETYGSSLRRRGITDDYDYGAGGANPSVQLVNAEIRLARAAFPDRPLYVVKTDLEDFYASIPHPVLRTILEQIGVGEAERDLLLRFVSPVVRTGSAGETARVRRGVPMNFTLSVLLAELVMRLLERYVRQDGALRVRVVRLVDDVCILTPRREDAVRAWERLREFCAGCGLAPNGAKSGALRLGGADSLPDTLPQPLPAWGMLELDDTGEWRVREEAFAAHLGQARERVSGADSIPGKVEQYNAAARDLLNALGLACSLGERHRESAREAVRRFHEEFFGPDRGILPHLCDALRRQFDIAEEIPEAWVYWPITAGGLGLRNPLITVAQYALAAAKAPLPDAPQTRADDWEIADGDWSAFYRAHLETLVEKSPDGGDGMAESLIQDFIQRGKEISGNEQTGLSDYWRWVLHTYGPQIRERFGTFRFLITELVPMQLIRQQKGEGAVASGAGESPPADDPFAD